MHDFLKLRNSLDLPWSDLGEMSERLKEHDWKSCVDDESTEGSNPSLSVRPPAEFESKRRGDTPMFKLASLILRNVRRNRRRSLLTVASIAVSLALLSLLLAMYQTFFYGEDVSPSEALRMVTRHRVSLTQPLPASHLSAIRGVPGVKELTPFSWFQGVYIDNRQEHFFARFAVDADRIFDIHLDWEMPADQIATFKQQRTACAIGEQIAKDQKLKIGDRVTIKGDIYNATLELTVVGIFKHPQAAQCLIFHREYLSELLLAKNDPQRDMVGTYLILADRPENVPRIARAIDTMFENSPYPTRTESEKEFGRSFLAFMGNIKLFLAAICAAVTFTILLVSANTVAMSVRERTREMAILRTLGYTPAEIIQLVLGEAILLSLLGGLVGLGIGYGLSKVLQVLATMFLFQGLKWQAALVVLSVAAIVGIVASVVPAVLASRRNVVESLRFTG
jgi:putative ABC transport system permease protein